MSQHWRTDRAALWGYSGWNSSWELPRNGAPVSHSESNARDVHSRMCDKLEREVAAHYEPQLALAQRVIVKLASRLGVDLADVEAEFGWKMRSE